MERVYEELDEARTEIEKLKTECQIKAELSESLKKNHNEQIIKLQEASLKIEKQAQEVNEMAEEASVAKQMYEDLKSSLTEKESVIKHLRTTNDELRVGCNEKSRKWEEENRELALALDEANEKSRDQEQKIRVYQEEIEGLKGLLSVSQKKCLEAEAKAKAFNELRQRDDVLVKLEEQNSKLEDQLKWKKEQFKHLEEAHEKLKDQFQAYKKEWEVEKCTLLDEICSLQTSLDSQTKVSKDFQFRLERCNQALAHEESRRKYLEVQLAESKTCFENAFSECQEAKSKIECLTLQRDEEIAALRTSLGTKEMVYKEMEYQSRRLEQENQELRLSLKELQEAQIHEAGNSSSLAKLRNKLRSLEQTHRDCPAILRTKEAEWSSQLEQMTGDLNDCRAELKNKDTDIKKLRMGLESSEQMHKDCSANLRAKEAEWSFQLQKMMGDLNECWSQLKNKDKDIKKLEMELEGLKQIHKDCSTNLRAKDAEWSSELEKMTGCLNDYWAELESKDATIKELKLELEGCHSFIVQLKLQNEEISLMFSMLKSELTEAQSKFDDENAKMDLCCKEREDNVSLLMKQLEMKNTALAKAQADIQEEREKEASLLRRVESLDRIEEQQLQKQKELGRYREMLEESSKCQLHLKQKTLQMESDFKEKLREVCDALDEANSELAEKICEGNEIEFELQIWRSTAERLKVDLENSHEIRRELEASLLSQVEVEETLKQEKDGIIYVLEEKEKRIDSLQQQIMLLDQDHDRRETENARVSRVEITTFESEKERFCQIAKEKERILGEVQNEIEMLEQESVRRELESVMLTQIGAERFFEQEKEKFVQLLKEKDQRIDGLLGLLKSLERNFNSSLISFSSQLSEKQVEINLVHEAWEKITAAEILAELEIEEKKMMIFELEDDIHNMQQKLGLQENSLSQSEQKAREIEAELEAKRLEVKKLTSQMETKLRNSDAMIEELKGEKRNLLEDATKLLSERENLLGFIVGLGIKISEFSSEDMQLMGNLERIVQTFDNNVLGMDLRGDDEVSSIKENVNSVLSPTTKRFEAISDERSPFRELNN